jgi:hypothetical protein
MWWKALPIKPNKLNLMLKFVLSDCLVTASPEHEINEHCPFRIVQTLRIVQMQQRITTRMIACKMLSKYCPTLERYLVGFILRFQPVSTTLFEPHFIV